MIAVSKSTRLVVESAVFEDRHHLANLIHFGSYVHRHLDWRPPLDWLGQSPFLIARSEDESIGALACPPDPPNVAWVRLFAASHGVSAKSVWEALWAEARQWLQDLELPPKVAAIPLHDWFAKLLKSSQFTSDHEVVVLSWNHRARPSAERSTTLNLRPMLLDDIPAIERIDAAAFGGVWQNSQPCLEIAFRQSTLATVAEEDGHLLGYQISTATQMGGHLARLAVMPDSQGTGIGYSLLDEMLNQCERRGLLTVTVNTQSNNQISLALYKKAGFSLTGEEYPVFEFTL